ncbi:MAG: hypothetical protein ABW205_06200, partial [Burkholderiales bacterium]
WFRSQPRNSGCALPSFIVQSFIGSKANPNSGHSVATGMIGRMLPAPTVALFFMPLSLLFEMCSGRRSKDEAAPCESAPPHAPWEDD